MSASAEPLRVVVVDDGDDYIELCHDFLKRYRYLTNCDFSHPCWECELQSGCRLKHAHDAFELEQILSRHGDKVDVVLLDIQFDLPVERLLPEAQQVEARANPAVLKRMRERQGIHILENLRAKRGAVPVVLMTSKSQVAAREPALSAELEGHRFTEMFGDEGLSAQSLAARIESFGRLLRQEEPAGRFFWGRTPSMARLRGWLEVFCEGDQPILILGETGTGKSFLAEQFIHPTARPGGAFCALDLSTIPDSLLAAELFGTSRGAFSDSVDRAGRFEFASGGTLFLDEIGNLNLETQKRLLAVIQERRVTRLGENRARPVDVKLVVATNEDLESRVRAGTFRADLYQRLNPAAKIELVPLRERLDDLPELLQTLTKRFFETPGNRRLLARFAALFNLSDKVPVEVLMGRKKPRAGAMIGLQVGSAAEQTLQKARWPGNIRQLELVWTNALTYQLVEQIAVGKVGHLPIIALDAQLLQDLIRSSSLSDGDGAISSAPAEPQRILIELGPAKSLNDVSREIEAQYFRELYLRCNESFERMARFLLAGDPASNARRVQLRFNNLGLSTRKIRGR